jgi:crotonobetainyl-CoA:carnitine CoA-transferase CaiB-like acyl-CoA transferase
MSGREDWPCKSYASWCDFSTGMAAAYGTVAALMYRLKTGRGQEVKANLLRTAMNIFHFNTLEAYMRGSERKPSGNRSQFGAPADLFRTRDGWVQVQVVGQALFERWVDLIGEREWLADSRLGTDSGRADHGELLSQRTQAWIGNLSTEDALAKLEKARIPAGPLYSPLQTLDDPQVAATGLLDWVDYPGISKRAPVATGLVEFSGFGAGARARAPTLGEHTTEILGDLGFTVAEIAELRAQRVV